MSSKKKEEEQRQASEKFHKQFWAAWEKHRKESQKEIRKLATELRKLRKEQKE